MKITKAEYLKAKKELYGSSEDTLRVFVDKSSYEDLIRKYPSAKGSINRFIEQRCEFFRGKTQEELEKLGFEEGKKTEFIKKVGDFVRFVHMDYEPPKIKKKKKPSEEKTEVKNEEIFEILKNPNLFNLITEKEFDKKITGEYNSRKAIFLSLCSIWVKNIQIPLNNFVSSESSAGKSYVCEKILDIFPKELYEKRSKITPEAFTYWHTNEDGWNWDGKICYLEDITQGVLDSPTFKIMCSEGSIATIVKNQKAIDLIVNGKPCILVTTARTNPTTELLNRFSITQLDESSKQTEDVTYNQALEIKNKEYDKKFTTALRLLKRKNVSVPFGIEIHNYITKHYSWNDIRMRRDFSRLRDLIKCSAILHQYQREEKEGEIIANKQDYEIARGVVNYIQTTTLKGLTHKLKKVYECCLKEQEFNAKEIHSKYPIVSMAMWYRYLDGLCERGLLTTELKDSVTILRDGTERLGKKVTYYKVPKTTSFNLPKYEELFKQKNRKDIIDRKDIKDIIDRKDSINYMNSINSTVNSGIDFSKLDSIFEGGSEK